MLLRAIDDKVVAATASQIMRQCLVRIRILALLIKRGDVEIDAKAQGSRIRLHFAGQHFQERRFARAIWADNADAIAALNAG